jgi:predicted DNA-binding antitoxin AbrB/MazE fold protein
MNQLITVTFDGEVLKPEFPLNLETNQKYQISITTDSNNNNNLEKLSSAKSCYDLAQELGIIGIAEDLPSDLSTNKNYFEGFGQ